jgi:penicillin-insensitive murein endopeptidase
MWRWAVVCLTVAGCAGHGVVSDGSSLSYGQGNEGILTGGVQLPESGDGYWVPPRWRQRGNIYGTEEIVTMIVRVGRRLQRELPDSPPFGVADLSPPGGGPSRFHRSHQTGRDVDVLFFMTDANGKPVPSTAMVKLDEDGVDAAGRRFDVARNWALVRALIEEPSVEIQYIFVYEPLEMKLLEYARDQGEPNGVVEFASYVLHQPSDSAPHDDHFHVRVHCAPEDRLLGCSDRGLIRWKKKGYKYELLEAAGGVAVSAIAAPASMYAVALPPSRFLRAWSLLLPMPFQYRLRTLAAR